MEAPKIPNKYYKVPENKHFRNVTQFLYCQFCRWFGTTSIIRLQLEMLHWTKIWIEWSYTHHANVGHIWCSIFAPGSLGRNGLSQEKEISLAGLSPFQNTFPAFSLGNNPSWHVNMVILLTSSHIQHPACEDYYSIVSPFFKNLIAS